MEELRPGRFELVEKASDGFGKVGKTIPIEESMVEEVMEGIMFRLIMS